MCIGISLRIGRIYMKWQIICIHVRLDQFVTPGAGAWLDISLLGVAFTVLTMCYLGTLAIVSGRIETVLTTHPRVTDAVRWAAGSVIVGFGIELAFSDRAPN